MAAPRLLARPIFMRGAGCCFGVLLGLVGRLSSYGLIWVERRATGGDKLTMGVVEGARPSRTRPMARPRGPACNSWAGSP